MKRLEQKFFFTMLLVVVAMTISVAQVRSDRAVVDQFEQKVKSLTEMINSAKTVQECAEINGMIEELEKENEPYKELLDRALYPDNYATTLVNLRGRLSIRQKDIGVIESQFQRILDLELQVRELSSQVDSLSRQNEQLMKTAKTLSAAAAINAAVMDSLNRVIATLRQNLQERDKLIFALLDSLFLQFDKNIEAMNDVEKQRLYGKLERRNVLTNIKKSLLDNLQFLETTTLTPADYVEITKQQSRFETQWKAFGPKIANIYLSGKKKQTEVATVDSLLASWSSKVKQGTWKSLAAVFADNGFPLPPFTNGNEFIQSFTSYMEDEIQNTKQDPEDVRAKRFKEFDEKIWNASVGSQWLPVLVESGSITAEQKSEIEEKVEKWRSSITPTPWGLYIAIAIVLIILVVALVQYIARKKEQEQAEE